MNTQKWIMAENKTIAKNYAPLPVVINRGEGCWLWDINGKRFLDMMSAYSAVSHGHCHPKLVKALLDQAQQVCVTSRAFHHDKLMPLANKLCQLSGLDSMIPMNTGAEAVETALKAARRWGYQKKQIPENQAEIIVCENNFHGRTISIISFSTDESYKKNFGPFTPGFKVVPFGDAQALEAAITPHTCAFIVEPIQGEAGILMPPDGYLSQARALCTQNNVLFIVDEIQSGLGRTGKWFAYQHENINVDGLILGKALGGGLLPVSAFIGNEAIMECFNPGSHGSTFGGNPLACHVALEGLNILEGEGLIENSDRLGQLMIDELKCINSEKIKSIRGRGLWAGIEIAPSYLAHDICLELMSKGVLTKEAHDTVIRLAPPLMIDESTLEWGLSRLRMVV